MQRQSSSSVAPKPEIDAILRTLCSRFSRIEAVAVVDRGGRVLGAWRAAGAEGAALAEAASSMLALGGETGPQARLGEPRQVVLRRRDGYLVGLRIGRDALLTARTRDSARLGLVLLSLRAAARRIEACW